MVSLVDFAGPRATLYRTRCILYYILPSVYGTYKLLRIHDHQKILCRAKRLRTRLMAQWHKKEQHKVREQEVPCQQTRGAKSDRRRERESRKRESFGHTSPFAYICTCFSDCQTAISTHAKAKIPIRESQTLTARSTENLTGSRCACRWRNPRKSTANSGDGGDSGECRREDDTDEDERRGRGGGGRRTAVRHALRGHHVGRQGGEEMHVEGFGTTLHPRLLEMLGIGHHQEPCHEKPEDRSLQWYVGGGQQGFILESQAFTRRQTQATWVGKTRRKCSRSP